MPEHICISIFPFCLQLLLDLEGEKGEELGKEAFVHVLVHLVQEEPVPDATIQENYHFSNNYDDVDDIYNDDHRHNYDFLVHK